MARSAAKALALFVLTLIALLAPRAARADQPGPHTVPVAVLAFDSEDAEENADALTGSMRSRIRTSQGWSLVEVTQSLGMLTAALKCPTHPPPDCQAKIAEHIKAERFIWGFVTKGGQGQVSAEIHLYQKGKPDTVVKETFSDNLKDAQDDKTLGKISQSILDRLGGAAVGTIVVKAGDFGGEVVIDGTKHVPLQGGTARVEIAPGGHSIELAGANAPAGKRNVLVTAGKEALVDLTPHAEDGSPGPSRPFLNRKTIGFITIGAGVVLGAVGIYELTQYLSVKDEGNNKVKNDPNLHGGLGACATFPSGQTINPGACTDDATARRDSLIAWITGGAGIAAVGIGAYLVITDSGSKSDSAASLTKPRVVPAVAPGYGGLTLRGAF